MTSSCSKCKAETTKMTALTEGGNVYKFCPLCIDILDKQERKSFIAMDLMDGDETLKMSQVQRDMLDARLRRARGETPWGDTE